MIYKATIAKGIYWMCKAIHSSSSQVGENFKRLNTKDKFHDNETGGVQFSQFKKNFEDLKCTSKVPTACLSQIAH